MSLQKTDNLLPPALDWAVATCEGWDYDDIRNAAAPDRRLRYSTNWSQGGPIIERETIELEIHDRMTLEWIATRVEGSSVCTAKGPTPLIAAMRCFVASRLGDEVDIPDELV